MGIKDKDTTTRNYVKNSLLAFIEGGKYSCDKKPLSLKWIIGIIRKSGIKRENLTEIFSTLSTYPKNAEEKTRLYQVLNECRKLGFLG